MPKGDSHIKYPDYLFYGSEQKGPANNNMNGEVNIL